MADDPAGVVFPGGNQIAFAFQIVSPSGKQKQYLGTTQFTLTSGTIQNGIWAATLTMPQFSEPGTWSIQQLLLQDAANNSVTLNAADIQSLGFSPNLSVSDGMPDTTPPVLEQMDITPRFLDASSGSQPVTLDLAIADDESGVSFAPTTAVLGFAYGPFISNPSRTKTLIGNCAATAGTLNSGNWQCKVFFPPFADAGAWFIANLTLKDADDNEVNYTTQQLLALGLPVSINVNQSTGGGSGPGIFSAAAVFFGGGRTTVNPTLLFAEPVNSATGNYFSSHVDLAVRSRGISLALKRSYNSLDAYSGPLGQGWTHSYNALLAENSGSGQVTIKQGDGSTISFIPVGNGTYSSKSAGLFDTLHKNGDGSFTLTRKTRTALTFSPSGQLLSIADRNGDNQTLAYDSKQNLVTVTDSLGRTLSLTYDTNNHLISVSDPTGRTIQYGFDSTGQLSSFTDALGKVTQYAYDTNLILTSAVDARGVMYMQNTYDAADRVVSQKNGRGVVTQFAYDTPSAGITTITDGNGNKIQHVYDSNLRITKVINGVGAVTSYAYDANNNKTGITNANGKTASLTYDASGNPVSIRNAAGNTASLTYDSFNDLTSFTDALGHTTAFSYDANGNLISAQDPAGNKTQYVYDGFGEPLTRTDPLGNQTQFSWDNAGNLIQVVDGAGRKHTLAYDGLGRMTSSTDGLGHIRKIQYDALSRIVSRTDPLGNQAQYTYDVIGELLKIVDANGNSTSYTYDEVHNLIAVTDAVNQKTTYSYDANDNRISFTNARGKVTAYAYDAANRRVRVTDPLSRAKAFAYDPAGNILQTIDGNNQINRFTYDALNRRLTSTYADGNAVSYAYDVDGDRVSMTDHNGMTSYSYDLLNRLVSVARFDGKTVRYGFDAAGRRSSLTYPDGSLAQYEFDGSSKLTAVTDWSGGKTTYAFDPAGRLTANTLPNGVQSIYSYDAANRLLSVSNMGRAGLLSSFTYVLDKVGNRLQVTSAAGGSSQYGYDPLYRLTSWTAPSGQSTQYAYDAIGNRTGLVSSAGATSFSFDDADEMLTAGAASFYYDGNGNRLSKSLGGATTSYGWDAVNRLISVSGPAANVQYGYDGDGNRVAQQANALSYSYINDVVGLSKVVDEEGPDGSINYLFGRGQIANLSSSATNYLSFDGLGSIASVTDPAAAPKGSYAYDPWGNLLNPMDPLGSKEKYKFAGQALDSAAGLYFMRARYYDPQAGGFLSKDPLSGSAFVPKTQNRYAYALNNPLKFSDPSGLAAELAGDLGVTSLFSAPTASSNSVSYGFAGDNRAAASSFPSSFVFWVSQSALSFSPSSDLPNSLVDSNSLFDLSYTFSPPWSPPRQGGGSAFPPIAISNGCNPLNSDDWCSPSPNQFSIDSSTAPPVSYDWSQSSSWASPQSFDNFINNVPNPFDTDLGLYTAGSTWAPQTLDPISVIDTGTLATALF